MAIELQTRNNKNYLSLILNGFFLLLALLMAAIIFFVSVKAELSVTFGAIYCIVILYSWVLSYNWTSIAIAIVCSLLVCIKSIYFQSDLEGYEDGLNTLISFVVIWVSLILVLIGKRSYQIIKNSNENLEILVGNRTSDLLKSQEKLDKSRKEYKNLVSKVKDYAIYSLDKNGLVLNWNLGAENLHGFKEKEIINTFYGVFFMDNDQLNKKPELLLKEAKEKGSVNYEDWRIRKDGSKFWASISLTGIFDKENNHIGYSKVCRDLTDRRKAELEIKSRNKELSYKNEELEQFAFVASHDLREPLVSIQSLTNIMLDDYRNKLDEEGNQILNYLNDASYRMTILIKGLLDYSRLGKNNSYEKIDCNEILDTVCADLVKSFDDKKAIIEYDKLPVISGHKLEIQILFQNLISNAIKYSSKKRNPYIKIEAVENEENIHFKVIDNGLGIEETQFSKIFVIFQRLHNRKEYEGTGIGLAHCKKIVELHKGKIWVESELGKGSIFHFTISK